MRDSDFQFNDDRVIGMNFHGLLKSNSQINIVIKWMMKIPRKRRFGISKRLKNPDVNGKKTVTQGNQLGMTIKEWEME